ncbi:hypothetical protein HPP92_027208 [Vanilla planifolia]|uniref:Uncharacterized protein n=1 Tax=Vanilla planifolia TaxID=51239 RepID=A0A835PCT1_VANPL|nr:hypothetical protein HPP92_027208 [Vanilla planifolia]
MEGQGSKRARTSSIRCSPTLRSSVYNLHALEEACSDSEENKDHPLPTSGDGKVFSGRSLAASCLVLLKRPFVSVYLLFRNFSRCFRRRSEPVVWFIDDEESPNPNGEMSAATERVKFYRNGDFYEGEFYNGRYSGSGVYNFAGQGRYEGDWNEGKFDGFGIERWANGSQYSGRYRRGLWHGIGVYRLRNGNRYAGEWVSGRSHGRGLQSCSDGTSYAGDFQCGAKHGFGFYHFRNGDEYRGEYFGDMIHGFGVYHFANGHCYEGSWHEGRRQGLGLYTFSIGESVSGEWDHGILKNTLPLANHSVQRAVQSAREALEKAVLLPRVEEQVKKAVVAAQKAAAAARVAAVKAVQNQMKEELYESKAWDDDADLIHFL